MKVVFNVYPTAFDCPGGGEIQLLKTKEALLAGGTKIRLYDQWNPDLNWPQIVHHFSVYGGSSVFCNYIKYQKKLPLVISPILWVRGDTSRYPMDEIRHLLNLSDLLFPNSEIEADALSEVFGVDRKKFHVTYNGVDSIFMQNKQPSGDLFRKKFGVEGQFLLNVANIETRKNQIALARVAAKLKTPVYCFGNIRSEDYFKQVLEGGKGYFKHLGYLDHKDELLRSAYQACDAFVLPSLLETPGLAALEAACMGTKLAVTQEGSTREYFSSFATYIDPKSEVSIENAIQEVMSKPKDLKLKEQVSSRFPWSETAKQCVAGYAKLL
ncbi:MAG: glycosyltransferase [Bdellovibrionales bacterium]|nr:glycosyltransferase [Bdellovibrionales bacterium]